MRSSIVLTAVLSVAAPMALGSPGAGAASPSSASTPRDAGTLPSYSFVDVGSLATVGIPRGVADDGTVATEYGAYRNGGFVTPPGVGGTSDYGINAISAGGLVLGQSATLCAHFCPFTWNPRTNAVTPYPNDPAWDDVNGAACGQHDFGTIDAANEAGGEVINRTPGHHAVCTSGESTQVADIALTPGAGDTQVPALHAITSLTPGFALGTGPDGATTTLLRRSGGTTTAFPTIALLGDHEELAGDGAFIGLKASPSPNGPAYVSPAGAISLLPVGTGSTQAHSVNDSHVIVGTDSTGAILWPTPTSTPVALNGVAASAGHSLDTADYLSATGNIVGQFDSDGLNGNVYELTVASTLSASIALTGADGRPFNGGASAIGQTLTATVTLTNASLTQSITALTASPPLTVAPSSSLQPTGPPPVVPSSLAPGASASYAQSYTVRAVGTARLSLTATGQESGGTVSADASLLAHLGQTIGVAVTFTQNGLPVPSNTLKLADADEGEIPQDLTAVVTLTNVSTGTQLNVHLNGNPVPSFHSAAQALPSVPLAVTAGPTGDQLSSLAPGAVARQSFTVRVTDNGVFDLGVQVLSSDDGGTGTNVSTGLGTLTVNPSALLWLSLRRVDNAPVRAGTEVEVRGTLQNRSETQAVFSAPLEPESLAGNAGGGRLVDDTSPANLALSYLADGVQLPFLGLVKPGQKIILMGLIDTSYVPSTRATVEYAPAGQVVNDDGTRTDLTGAQLGTSTGTSPITIAIDARDPDVPPADVQTEIQNFEKSVVQGTGAWAEGHFQAALNFLQHPVDGTAAGVTALAKAVVHTPRDLASAAYILASVDVYATVYGILTPQQRADFERGILDDFDASAVHADNAELSRAVAQGFGSFADALAHHDYNRVASLAGSGVATSGGLVVDALISDIFFQKLALGLRAGGRGARNLIRGQLSNDLVLADQVRSAGLSHTIVRTVDGIKAGQNLLVNSASALINAWGLTPEQIVKLQAFCKENRLIIAVRSRSKRAADLIRRGLALGKNEILKLKGVNAIDTEWLGYSQADLNKLVNAEPVPYHDLVDELLRRHASRQVEAIVLERWQLRFDEYHSPKVNGVMQAANAEGKIEWGFNGSGNGVPAADRSGQRSFRLRTLDHATMPFGASRGRPRVYQLVEVGNREGRGARFVSVTQDVDVAAILSENNSIPGAVARLKFYEFLSDVLGIEHPETVSWINDGDIVFLAKLRELRRLFEGGGETLAVFGPDGSSRAAFLNPALTIYDAATKGGVILFQGGYNNVYAKVTATVRVNLRRFF